MDVFLLTDVPGLGKAGEIHRVKPGYARNFLFAKKLAQTASPAQVRLSEQQKKGSARYAQEQKKRLQKLQEQLHQLSVHISARAHQEGKLYGSISSADVVHALEKEHHIRVPDSFSIQPAHIKEAGEHTLRWSLDAAHHGTFQLFITPQPE